MPASERDNLRQVFFDAWNKHQNNALIEPLEAQIITIITQHPEYHGFLNQLEQLEQDHFFEQNPFLHMSLHLAIQEQIATNRPSGIKVIYSKLCVSLQDTHAVEHKMMDCLASILWNAQTTGKMPDENHYLEMLLKL